MSLLRPELLALLLPAAWVLSRTRSAGRPELVLRGLLALVLVALAGGLHLRLAAEGRDLVVAVDRSRSMPEGATDRALEWIRLAEEARGPGDRVGVVTFGADVRIERLPSEGAPFQGFGAAPDPHGSDLGAALETALALVDDERPGSVLLLSDGEENGADPAAVARRAAARGARVDVVALTREGVGDLAVRELVLPARVDAGAPFQFAAWIESSAATEARFALERDGEVLSRGERRFATGTTRLVFRDVVDAPGLATYRLRLEHAGDRFPENDKGLGAVRVEGARGVLLLNPSGEEDTLSGVLRGAGFPVTVATPERAPTDALGLEAFRAVVLENVPAGRMGDLRPLGEFVIERGGGLLMTGGRASFGTGGYHLSAVDEALPVSMELRSEQREQGLALAVALDRSGSMGAPAADGRTKMQLAAEGAAAACELLSALDSLAVFAVDTRADPVVPRGPVEDPIGLSARIRAIPHGGGGIDTLTALRACAESLAEAEQANRHVLLFADAADANMQEGCAELVDDLARLAVTVSVIALGTEADPHAAFLADLAARGGGEVYFSSSPEDLPRLFAEDTLRVVRSTFVEERTPVRARPGLGELGVPGSGASVLDAPAHVDAYNRVHLRAGAALGWATADDEEAPLLAFGRRGLGRGAALAAPFGGSLLDWPGAPELAATLVRWCAADEEASDVFADARREGMEAVLTARIDPDAPERADLAELAARVGPPGRPWRDVVLERVGDDAFEARVPLRTPGVMLGEVRLGGDRHASLPPVALAYSPEFEPRAGDDERGARLLRRVAQESGGAPVALASELFRGERHRVRPRPLTLELALAAALLLVLEIAGRRLGLWRRLERLEVGGPLARVRRSAAGRRERRRRAREALEAEPDRPAAPAAPPPPSPKRTEAMADALSRARREAGRRTDRS